MKTCSAFLLLAGLLLASRASAADDVAREKELLQGTWAAVSLTDGGRAEAPENVKKLKLIVKGDKYTSSIEGKSFSAVYKIDPGKKPKEMDVTFEEGPLKGQTMQAIYSIDGDQLKICGSENRPAEFVSKPGSQVVLFAFKREKP